MLKEDFSYLHIYQKLNFNCTICMRMRSNSHSDTTLVRGDNPIMAVTNL